MKTTFILNLNLYQALILINMEQKRSCLFKKLLFNYFYSCNSKEKKKSRLHCIDNITGHCICIEYLRR